MDRKDTQGQEIERWGVRILGLVAVVAIVVLGLVAPCQAATYTLTITASHGSVAVSPSQPQYDDGQVVQLIAKPDAGYSFTGWSGDASGNRIVLNLTMDGNKSITAGFGLWQAPIGTPAPDFGITEMHTMYIGQAYDFGSGAEAYKDAGNGPYTHYVDSSHASATDSSNPYGSPTKPRSTVPRNLDPGSVVEIHNSADNNGFDKCLIDGIGTAAKPIFVRGVGLPRLDSSIEIGYYGDARYIIVEGIDAYDGAILGREGNTPSFTTSYIAVRKCNFSGDENGGGLGIATWTANAVEQIVFFGNVIHDNGVWDPLLSEGDRDIHGMVIGSDVSHVWIVDNEMYHNEGDGLQINAGSEVDQSTTHHIYVGRNVSHHNKQTGLWTKQAVDVIFTENEIFGHRASSSSMGQGMGFQYAPERVWFLFNKVYDNEYGFAYMSDSDLGFGTKSYCIGNLIYDIHHDLDYRDSYNPNTAWAPAGVMAAGGEDRYFIGNTLYDVDAGFNIAGSGLAYFANNIVSGVGTQGESHIWAEDEASGLTWLVYNNLLYQSGGNGRIKHYTTVYSVLTMPASYGVGNIDADPKLMGPESDFHLGANSPAINVGLSSDTVQTVFDEFASRYGIDIRIDMDRNARGQTWDLGSYEYTLDPVTDLSVSDTSQNSLTLAWTVPGQEGTSGLPGRYDIRYSGTLITEASWDAATQAQGEPAPGTYGQAQSFTLTGLDSGQTYYVAVKSSNDAGSTLSALSNVVPGTTAASGNHAPVLDSIGDKSVFQGQTLDFVVSATDEDAGDTLAYSATDLPSGADFDTASRRFTWAPTSGQSGTYMVAFEVTDSHVAVSETIVITVVQTVNHAPELMAIGNKETDEGQILSFTVAATDIDGGTLTYDASPLPTGANFVNQLFSWVPTYSQAGSYSVTFTVIDNGALTDSEQISITVNNVTPDLTPPSAHDYDPVAAAVQVPLNSLIALTVSDSGRGVDPNTVAIRVNNQLVYTGNMALYQSDYGDCRRIGTPASYRYYYQADDPFDFNEDVTVRVDASDLAGNAMTTASYQFATEMRTFGDNQMAASDPAGQNKGAPATVRDSGGNIWVVYHAGAVGQRDIYVSKLAAGETDFTAGGQLTTDLNDQGNPAIAIGTDDRLYVVWQDDRQGNSDIYMSTSADGITWTAQTRVTDSSDNQVSPAVAVDGRATNRAYVAWQDDRAGHEDIYVAYSDNRFQSSTVTRVTSNASDQSSPAIAVDAANNVYLAWIDDRNGTDDIFGAASNSGPWTNVAVATGAGGQFDPAIAAESLGSVLHFLWTSNATGDEDVYYASSNGMPGSPLAGTNIIDDTSDADQSTGSIAATGSTGDDLKVFACWRDGRNLTTSGQDGDLYFTEIQGGGQTNVLIADDGTGANQSQPALGVDAYGYPYAVWTDDRDGTTEIYYAGSTFADPTPLGSAIVTAAAGGTVGVSPPAGLEDVSVVVPAGVCPHDATITIARVLHPPKPTWSAGILAYEFGPSGLQFTQPVTVTIPYLIADFPNGTPLPYWYDPETSTVSQQGISNVRTVAISTTVRAIRFKTTHFTTFLLAEDDGAGDSGGGGGGGGCALTPINQGRFVDFMLPYLGLAMILAWFKRRDRKARQCFRGTGKQGQ